MQDYGQPQVEPRTDAGHVRSRGVAELLAEQRLDVPGANPARGQLVAIPRLGEERLAPQLLRRLFDRLFERQVLVRVQRVVMDEDADRSLRRQQVRELIDQFRQVHNGVFTEVLLKIVSSS